MKISFRILLINFVIVVLVFVSSTVAFYSVTRKIIYSQPSRNLMDSAKDFIYLLQSIIQDTDDEFLRLATSNKLNESTDLQDSKVDFIIKANSDSTVKPSLVLIKPSLQSGEKFNSIVEFSELYPNLIMKQYKGKDGSVFYYGRILNSDLLDNLSKRMRADISILHDNSAVATSNNSVNQKFLPEIIRLSKELSNKDNYSIANEELEKADLFATLYTPRDLPYIKTNIRFLIFSTLPEAADLRENINNLIFIIGLTGITLSLILALIFTEKIRKQITHLSKAADITRSGDLSHRVTMLTKDELGRLGMVFNSMLDVIEKNQNAKNEYTDFIALINQNPALDEISEAALTKIINATGYTVGRLLMVEGKELRLIASYGLKNELTIPGPRIDLYSSVIEKNETVEFKFDENFPKIHTGLASLEIRHLIIMPVIYNKKVIAILELASIGQIKDGAKEYLNNIHHQLAIGLSNANAFRQLTNLVDELKKLNEEYQKQNEQIKDQNKTLLELHKQLKEKAEELELQREKALDAATHKSQFLASMSHELKTPLNSVLGLTELVLNEKSTSKPSKEKLEIVLRNGNRLMNLINDILNFSKLEAGKMELQVESFAISELLNDIDLQISPLLKNKDLSFKISDQTQADCKVISDKFKINQILINLLSNAIKFTEKGNVELSASFSEDDKSLRFEVSDTGIGVADKDKELIFEEFRQVDGSSKRKYNGTGLGLAISRRYAELLNGKLDCESRLGSGSVFTLVVPVELLSENEMQTNSGTSINTDGKPDNALDAPSKSVLVIDDNKGHQSIIGNYLTSKNYSVIEAFDTDEALQKAQEFQPFIIVLNIFLPKEKGWALLKSLKTNPLTIDIPVVLISILDELNTGFGLEVYDYLIKPLDTDLLSNLVGKLQNSTHKEIKSILYIGKDEKDIEALNNCDLDSCDVHYVNDALTAFKSVLRIQPGLVLIDISLPKSDGISLLKKLKDSVETRDIPLILCLSEQKIEQEAYQLNNSIERAALKAKGHPIDVLKTIKDRIHLEEGLPEEDTSTLWLESAAETDTSNDNNLQQQDQQESTLLKSKVLVVDDDEDTLFTVGEIVRQSGCEPVFAKNGIECLSALEQFTPDLVLLDIMMPQMDGFETIKKIRANGNNLEIPVYALTALAMIDEKEILIRNGFNDFIPKPVNAGMLISKIEKLLAA
ncbi:MAG: response regulator [Bacteroidota bacterium]|nr:response regulator [Bacteroidota bacterium]